MSLIYWRILIENMKTYPPLNIKLHDKQNCIDSTQVYTSKSATFDLSIWDDIHAEVCNDSQTEELPDTKVLADIFALTAFLAHEMFLTASTVSFLAEIVARFQNIRQNQSKLI